MKSQNFTTRTYTAPRCVLEVSTLGSLSSDLTRFHSIDPVDFTLHFHPSEPGAADGVTVKGSRQQLVGLHRSVSQYVQNLISQFPRSEIAIGEDPEKLKISEPIECDLDGESDIIDAEIESVITSEPNIRSGLNNSPRLQHLHQQSTSPPSTQFSLKNVTALLNRSQGNSQASPVENRPLTKPASANQKVLEVPTEPHLSHRSDGFHSLHLGDLASSGSPQVVNLSSLELFDLAAILDRSGAELGTNPVALPQIDTSDREPDDRADRDASLSTANPRDLATTLSTRLPNLPHLPADGLVPDRARRHKGYRGESLLPFSASVPWVAAAAVAVGAPLFIFGPNSSSLKELTGKIQLPNVKLPDLNPSQKSLTAKLPQPEKLSSDEDLAEPKSGSWQIQSVQPPTAIAPANISQVAIASRSRTAAPDPAGVKVLPSNQNQPPQGVVPSQPIQDRDRIGVAALPPTLGGAATAGDINPKNSVVYSAYSPTSQVQVTAGTDVPGATTWPPATKKASKLSTHPDRAGNVKPSGLDQSYINPIAELPAELTRSQAVTQLPEVANDVTAATMEFAMRTIAESNDSKSSPTRQPIAKTNSGVTHPSAKSKVKSRAVKPPRNPQVARSQVSVSFSPDLPMMPASDLSVPSVPKSSFPSPQIRKPTFQAKLVGKQRSLTSRVKTRPVKIAKKTPAPARIEYRSRTQPHLQSLPALVPVQPEMLTPEVTQPNRKLEQIPLTATPPLNPDGTIAIENQETAVTPQKPTVVAQPPGEDRIAKAPSADPFNNPHLQEAKRYLEGKWKPDPQQFDPLQYVLEISSKSGAVKNVAPQGKPAQTYMEKAGLIKPGEQMISPTAAGNSDRKIRIILQPDGHVDAFEEP